MYEDRHLARFHASYIPEPNSGCWLWTGPIDTAGYGFFTRHGKEHERAHRTSWTIHCGPIPDGMKVCHRCDNRTCINPDHLFLGTQADNIADMDAKGRRRSGPKIGTANPMAKFNEATVRRVRELIAQGFSQKEVGRQVGMSQMNVCRIANRKLWGHVL